MNRKRKLRMGMVGGGQGAFIGAVHRMAANLDGHIELVCGAFSSDPQKSIKSGHAFYLFDKRCYGSFGEMITKEKALPEEERMDFVSIVTPNHMHFEPAKWALENGFPVIIDKPLAFNYEEAIILQKLVKETKLPFAVTYTYSAYPMVKQAKKMVEKGEIGAVRKVMVEYPQGWLTDKLEDTDQKQAAWRSDPKKAGISNCFGDIGTHCAHLAEYITGLKIEKVLSKLTTIVTGRLLDDDANVLLQFEKGASGVLSASQVATGHENDLMIRIYGEKGGLEWRNQDLNTLKVMPHGAPVRLYRTGVNHGYLHDVALAHTRTPSGHPEGYIEAFANIYRNFAFAVNQYIEGSTPDLSLMDYPGIDDGVKGMAMVHAVVKSSEDGNLWTDVKKNP
ncbi:MAG: putative dehydrogenase [Cyclobacteriaceae bacterium]|jgi:predicted dehydrogenase